MKRMLAGALALTIAVGMVAGAAYAQEEEGFVKLFNGKNLDNWVKRGGDAEYRIEGDAIVGTTVPGREVNGKVVAGTDNTFLCTVKDYDDFILEVEFKVHPKMNSGVQIRSLSKADFKDGRVHGYQVEIDPSDRAWTGGIYDEARNGWLFDLKDKPEAGAAFKQGEWNKFRVEAKGDSIKTWVNGVPAADLKDDTTDSGFIALQVHSTKETEPMEVMWRNIRIKELD